MPIEHRPPTMKVIKELYAHAYRCGYDGCTKPLFRVDDETGERTLNSLICHINARSEGGPRWLEAQLECDNRSVDNLILMCREHAAIIDDPRFVSRYSPDLLRSWRTAQLAEYDRISQGWKIDSDMARQVARTSFSNVGIAINHSTVHLGGQGGRAPGAGGGGGGAIGRNAVAGDGGQGGVYRVDNGKFTLAIPAYKQFDPLNLHSMEPYGAGAGGPGAIGDEARAGGGGSGGDGVEACIDLEELRRAGWCGSADVIVPEGGHGARLPGAHGGSGGDVKLVFRHHDGSVLKEVLAPGGIGGRSGYSLLLGGYKELQLNRSEAELDFRVTTLMPCNAADIKDGLIFVLGGGWTSFSIPTLPFGATWAVLCCASWAPVTRTEGLGVFLVLDDPVGRERACQAIHLSPSVLSGGNVQSLVLIGAQFDVEGIWHLRVRAGGQEFAHFAVTVHVRSDGIASGDIISPIDLNG